MAETTTKTSANVTTESAGGASDGRNEVSQPGFTGTVAIVALALALAVGLRRGAP